MSVVPAGGSEGGSRDAYGAEDADGRKGERELTEGRVEGDLKRIKFQVLRPVPSDEAVSES